MGYGGLSYAAVKMSLIAEEIYKGGCHQTDVAPDRSEQNPFQWNLVCLNLPGRRGTTRVSRGSQSSGRTEG